jgi:hypothetical protein
MKFHENAFSGSQVVAHQQTDTITLFLQLSVLNAIKMAWEVISIHF